MPSDAYLLHVTQVYACCILAVMVWDWVTSLTQEWQVIWKGNCWSAVKVLYLFARYWAIGTIAFTVWAFNTTASYEACTPVIHWVPATSMIITLSTEGILAIRTYSIWGRPRWLLALILVLLAIETAFMIWATVVIRPLFPPGFQGPCIPAGGSGPIYLYFLSPFVVDTILTVLAFIKCRQISQFGHATNLVKVFLRDGFVYFIVVAASNFVEAIFFLQPIPGLKGVNGPPALALSAIMCCRLVLSLRSMADPTAKDGGGRVGDTELSVRSNERQATGVHKLNLPIMNQETVVSVDGGSHTTRVRTPGPNVDMPFAMPPKNNNRLSVVNAGDPTKSLSRVPSSDTLEEEDEKENLRDNAQRRPSSPY